MTNKDKQRSLFELLFILLIVILVFIVFFQFSPSLLHAWQTDEYSHAPLIPVLALLIGWHKLTETRPLLAFSWSGVWLLLVGLLLAVFSSLSAFEPPAHYGFILTLTGVLWAAFGTPFVKAIAVPLVYLVFAIPLPRLVYVALSGDLQLLSSTLGVVPLDLLGFSVYQEGNVIDLGGYKLQVVEACNGLRYLFPLMSFGFLLAIMVNDKPWKRVVLFLSTIPITILMNALRISVIGITVNYWGKDMATGLLHDFEGWTVFSLCLLLLAGETKLLLGASKTGTIKYDYLGLPKGSIVSGRPVLSKPLYASAFLLLAFLALTLGGQVSDREEIKPPHPAFPTFPLSLGSWKGQQDSLDKELAVSLGFSDYWMANYLKDTAQTPVSLYIAYYDSQRVGSTIHSPSNCLPGSGWEVEAKATASIATPTGTLPVSRLLITKGDGKLLVYYWFDGRGRILTEQYGAKWYLFVDSLTKNRTDGALVRLTTPVNKGEDIAVAEQRLQSFVADFDMTIKSYIPR